MKISFNDDSLHTTFEYPSESSLVREAEAEAGSESEAEAQGEGDTEDAEDAEAGPGRDGAAGPPFTLFLPRATFVSSVAPESPRRPDGRSGECARLSGQPGPGPVPPHAHTCAPRPAGLSSYTPKHSTAFSAWPEQTPEPALREVEPAQKEVMVSGGPAQAGGPLTPARAPTGYFPALQLTPASHKDLSDFRSEPALYF